MLCKGSAEPLVQSLVLFTGWFWYFFLICALQNAASNISEEQFSHVEPAQPVEQDSPPAERDTYLIEECVSNKYTHKSCKKVFCHPWERCVEGKCLCKLPYQCPKNGTSVCSTTGRHFLTYCHLKSYECQRPEAKFLNTGKCVSEVKPVNNEDLFVCDSKWTMNEANVACRHLGFELGAEYYHTDYNITEPSHCFQVTCRGLETSLAECYIEKKLRASNEGFVSLQCQKIIRECSAGEFNCANDKCISVTKTCDGINDCGDLSDELCCKVNIAVSNMRTEPILSLHLGSKTKHVENHSMEAERKLTKTFLPQINCGVVNHTLTRRKRIIGGQIARKGEFPWQVAIKETGTEGATVYCGGVYIGGCWVLTAAHCVRATRVNLYRVWIGLLDTIRYDRETDTYRLKQLIIHENYNAATYENDIALLELKGHGKGECSLKYSTPACIPWSEYMFKAGDKCKVSGWGLEKGI
ncbi:hypothetical protein ASZ78_012264 [Callipepla squamata]|uniref:Complement factor I n=1 Tax=Callipepla squamata TaxID=9009 RepID=A0A226NKD7_CALSU|nr:hypothetical protein ASZ78_012264 [Callipepla squamata]